MNDKQEAWLEALLAEVREAFSDAAGESYVAGQAVAREVGFSEGHIAATEAFLKDSEDDEALQQAYDLGKQDGFTPEYLEGVKHGKILGEEPAYRDGYTQGYLDARKRYTTEADQAPSVRKWQALMDAIADLVEDALDDTGEDAHEVGFWKGYHLGKRDGTALRTHREA